MFAPFNREIELLVPGMPTEDGAGVRLVRVLTQNLQRRLDPFLMLDFFHSDAPNDYLAGFPDHPHRGFETVTYMLAGRMRHRDNAGNEGLLEPGGVQWMTAGRGIVHSELPEQQEGLMSGFQLWVNLPAQEKMTTPGYQDLPAAAIPEVHSAPGVTVRVIAGEAFGVQGAIQKDGTRPLYLDVHLSEGGTVQDIAIAPGHNAFIYVYQGELEAGPARRRVAKGKMGILTNPEQSAGVSIATVGADTRFLVIAGRPLNEPIAQWGPFVMNTRAEVEQAMQDFQAGLFGKEAA